MGKQGVGCLNKLQERTFGDDDFVTWYQILNKNEQKELWKEIEKCMEEGYEKFFTLSSIYKTRRKQ